MGQRLNDSCLVCAAQAKRAQKLMTTTAPSDPGPEEHSDDEFIIAEDDDIPNHNHHVLLEDSKVEGKEHLKTSFILNRIFKLPEESIGDLVAQLEYATNGVQLCSHCDERARQFHQTLHKMSELQRSLDEIEKDFKDKIERSKNVPSTFREWIRRCVVKADSFSEPHSEQDGDENHEHHQKNQHPVSLNIVNEESIIINAEVVELDTFDEPLTSEGQSPSTLLNSYTNDNDDDEVDEYMENLPSTKKRKKQEAKVLPSKKKLESVVNAPLPALQIRRKSEGILLQRPSHPTFNREKNWVRNSLIVYKCAHCTHKTVNIQTFESHKQCHEEGSRATPCNECNVFVLSGVQVSHHRFHCVPTIQNSLATEEPLKLKNWGEMRNINQPDPYYITFQRRNHTTTHYQCLQCPYETLCKYVILAHVELHGEGSLAAPCGECGCFMLPEYLDTHRKINHSVVEEVPIIPGPSSAALPKLKCSKCSYKCQKKGAMKYHVTGHNHQVAESKCKDCGCYLSLRLGKTHKIYCFARATQEAEDTRESEGENLMQLVE